LTSVFSINN